jgi:hypothetical protein
MARKSVSVHAERFAIQDIHSGSMVANSEVTPFWSYFRIGGHPAGTRYASTDS